MQSSPGIFQHYPGIGFWCCGTLAESLPRRVNADSLHLLYTSSRGVVLLKFAACDLVRVQESKKTEPSDK
jgi:hypothetical protein